MILAASAVLSFAGTDGTAEAARAIREASLEAIADGVRTPDLSGHASTTEFTDEVIRRVRQKLDIWATSRRVHGGSTRCDSREKQL